MVRLSIAVFGTVALMVAMQCANFGMNYGASQKNNAQAKLLSYAEQRRMLTTRLFILCREYMINDGTYNSPRSRLR